MWSQSPLCAICGCLVAYPDGFELDHIEPLKADGGNGEDTEENCQILCSGPNGCHRRKTAADMGYTFKPAIGPDGWPL